MPPSWTVGSVRQSPRSQPDAPGFYRSPDDEWAEIAPLIPPATSGGNKRSVNLRKVVNGLMYILSTGCQWRALASPTAAIIDAQSVKSAEKAGAHIDPHASDAGKKDKGKKRHVLVDTQSLMLHAIVTAADIQDRNGGAWLLGALVGLYPFLLKLYADGGYQGPSSARP